MGLQVVQQDGMPLPPASSYLSRFRRWWEAADLQLAAFDMPPLDYEQARALFDCELEPADVPEYLAAAARIDVQVSGAAR